MHVFEFNYFAPLRLQASAMKTSEHVGTGTYDTYPMVLKRGATCRSLTFHSVSCCFSWLHVVADVDSQHVGRAKRAVESAPVQLTG